MSPPSPSWSEQAQEWSPRWKNGLGRSPENRSPSSAARETTGVTDSSSVDCCDEVRFECSCCYSSLQPSSVATRKPCINCFSGRQDNRPSPALPMPRIYADGSLPAISSLMPSWELACPPLSTISTVTRFWQSMPRAAPPLPWTFHPASTQIQETFWELRCKPI